VKEMTTMPRYEATIHATIEAPDQAAASRTKADLEKMLSNPLVKMQLDAKRVALKIGEPKLAGGVKK
jgi:hypothetical protein